MQSKWPWHISNVPWGYGMHNETISPMEPQRDSGGWWSHPDYIPNLEEGALRVEFDVWLEVNGVECVARLMEDDVEPDSPVAQAWENGDADCSAWTPKPPEGEGWFLVSIHDTEDGPSAVWLRKLPDAQPTTLYDALLRHYRPLFDERAKLALEVQNLQRQLEWADDRLTRCTCPSGDGSLRWPCPVHPAVAVSVPDATLTLTDEQIDAVLDSRGNIAYVIADKRERLHLFAREIIRTAMLAKQGPSIPIEVIDALCKFARIRADFDDFDGDRRGIADCLDEAEQELIVTVTKHAAAFANTDKQQPVSAAIRDVIVERQRQITAEGWTAEHDDQHESGELARAAACYAVMSVRESVLSDGEYAASQKKLPFNWPWEPTWWKPTNPRRDLVKAAALILAEIERLDRANGDKGVNHVD